MASRETSASSTKSYKVEKSDGEWLKELGKSKYPVVIITWVGLPVDSLESIGSRPIDSRESIGSLRPSENDHWARRWSALSNVDCGQSSVASRVDHECAMVLVGQLS